MRELVISPSEECFRAVGGYYKYLEADFGDYDVQGYLYFYRHEKDSLTFMKVPYTGYRSTKGKLLMYCKSIENPDVVLVLTVEKEALRKADIYYRSSFRNYSYEKNRVIY